MPGDVQKIVLRLAYLVAIVGALLPFLNWGRVCFVLVRLRSRPASLSSGIGYTDPDFRLSTMEVPR